MIYIFADTYQCGVDFIREHLPGHRPKERGMAIVTPDTINRHMVGPFQTDHTYRCGLDYGLETPERILKFRVTTNLLLELASIRERGIFIMREEEDERTHAPVQEQ